VLCSGEAGELLRGELDKGMRAEEGGLVLLRGGRRQFGELVWRRGFIRSEGVVMVMFLSPLGLNQWVTLKVTGGARWKGGTWLLVGMMDFAVQGGS